VLVEEIGVCYKEGNLSERERERDKDRESVREFEFERLKRWRENKKDKEIRTKN